MGVNLWMGNYILHKTTDVFTFSLDWAFLARDTAIFPTTGSGDSEPVIHSIYFGQGNPLQSVPCIIYFCKRS